MAVLKSRQAPAGHAAGIYADMTLDGPEIGTLVAVVDRAKNLPNRRTMGKQDPYCAMRLAKEAKKTETDRRGGQTPKWDQELRFNVHDSPDYYRLKCSIFNDDKKADLIGEAWIDLRDVIKPGGGQRDVWQQLNFKGKYAGDIRMELTYYDSREKPTEKKSTSDRLRSSNTSADLLMNHGSRQLGPRDIPRRPLPANPVSQQPYVLPAPSHSQQTVRNVQKNSHSGYQQQIQTSVHAPIPVRPHEQQVEEYHEPYAEEIEDEYTDDFDQSYGYDFPDQFDSQRSHHYQQQQAPQWQQRFGQDFGEQVASPDYPQLDETHDTGLLDVQPQQHQSQALSSASLPQPICPDDHEIWTSNRPQPLHTHSAPSSPYSSPQSARPAPSPANSDGQLPLYRHQDRSSMSSARMPAFKDSPLRQSMSQHDNGTVSDLDSVQDIPPPPPPKHQDTPPRKPRNDFPPSCYMPQPLRLGGKRTSVIDRSPLQVIEDSSNARRLGGLVQPQTPTRPTPHDRYGRETSQPRSDSHSMRRSSYGTEQGVISPSEGQRPRSRHAHDPQNIQYATYEDQTRYEEPQQWSNSDESHVGHGREHYRRSAIETRAASSNPYTNILQNSANNESPYPVMENRRLSGIPFGPDSYDVLNPGSSPATNEGTAFETPEQARNSGKLRDSQRARDLGPIIGNDGQEVDPSDHLPSDTWAPEPERKTKKPEHVIHIRSRNNPSASAGIRSSPITARSTGNSPYQASHIASSPQLDSPGAVAGRNRLQKSAAARPLPTQPYQQSPKQPQQQTSPANFNPAAVDPYQRPQRSSWRLDSPSEVVRPPPSEYQVPIGNDYNPYGSAQSPFRGSTSSAHSHDNGPYATGYNKSGQRDSYYGSMNAHRFDDPLAAEMSMIDIGPSRGSAGRTRLRSNRAY